MARGKTTGGNGSNADGAKPRARKSAAAEGAGRGGSRGSGKSGAKSGTKGGASRRGGKAEEQGASTVRNTANRAAETVQQAASAATEPLTLFASCSPATPRPSRTMTTRRKTHPKRR
jgi:hypothetical protein